MSIENPLCLYELIKIVSENCQKLSFSNHIYPDRVETSGPVLANPECTIFFGDSVEAALPETYTIHENYPFNLNAKDIIHQYASLLNEVRAFLHEYDNLDLENYEESPDSAIVETLDEILPELYPEHHRSFLEEISEVFQLENLLKIANQLQSGESVDLEDSEYEELLVSVTYALNRICEEMEFGGYGGDGYIDTEQDLKDRLKAFSTPRIYNSLDGR